MANCKLRNELEINPKGVKCKCNPCSFKISKNDKTMNVSRDENVDIELDSEDHSISFSSTELRLHLVKMNRLEIQ